MTDAGLTVGDWPAQSLRPTLGQSLDPSALASQARSDGGAQAAAAGTT